MTATPKPRFTIEQASKLGFEMISLVAAETWIKENAASNDFAASLYTQLSNHDGKLTHAQWSRAIDASNGKTFTRRRRKAAEPMKPDTTAAPSAAPSVDDFVSITNDRSVKLSPAQRGVVRKAITKSNTWPAYSKAAGINSGKLSGNVLFDAADKCGVDIGAVLAAHNDKVRDGNAAFAATATKGSGDVDWQRVRSVARDEVQRRLDPVVISQLVIDQGKTQKPLKIDGIKHPNFDKAFIALNCTDNGGFYQSIMLVGPAGTGKSFAARQFAKALGLKFYFQSIAQESYDILGYEKVNGEYKETAALQAFRDGGVLLLDEGDAYDEKALVAFNAALANGEMALLDGTIVKRHKDFRCIMAANTFGLGATSDYTARSKLDLSTWSRFAIRVDWFSDPAIELEIATAARGDIGAAWCREVQAIRVTLDRLDLPPLADQRCIEAGSALIEQGLDLESVRELTYLSVLDNDQRQAVMQTVDAAKLVRG